MSKVTAAVVVNPSLRDRMKAAALSVATPQAIAPISLLAGVGLSVAGVYVLAGIGWALLAGAFPFLLLSVVLIRGLIRAQ